MYTYNFEQWVAFFYIYCFIGWCIESTLVSIEAKKFINRGFLRIPMLPLYGFGALTMLFTSLPFKDNPTMVFISSALSCTILEYITGVVMEAIFKVKYWDYSQLEYNINGKICPLTTLFWGFLSLFMTYQLHDGVSGLVLNISNKGILLFVIIVSVIFVADLIYSIKSAIDVKDILAGLTEIRKQLNLLYKQRHENQDKSKAFKISSAKLNAERHRLLSKLSFYSSELLKAHPKASSPRFSEAFKELKTAIKLRGKKNR